MGGSDAMRICNKCKKIKPKQDFYEKKLVREKHTYNTKRYVCKTCWAIYSKKYMENYHQKHPWLKHYTSSRARCDNPNSNKYHRYGGRGIKHLLSVEEVKILWFRDNALMLKSPTLDRINNDGHYEYKNCRFIERSENSRKGSKKI